MTDSTGETQLPKQAPIAAFSGASENCWRDWADRVPVMLWIADAESGCNYFNLQWTEFTGLSEAEICDRGWRTNIHPDDLDCWEQIYLNAWNFSSNFKREYRLKRADGEYRWIEETAVAKLTPAGELAGFIGTATDISDAVAAATQRKKAEIALQQAHKILEASLNRFDLAVSAAFDGIWDAPINPEDALNPENAVYWSPRFKELLGYESSEFENVLGAWISRVHPEDLERVFAAISGHLEQKIPFKDIEYRMQKKSGEYIWLAVRGQALWDENGRPLRFAGSIRDVSDRKKVQEQLRAQEQFLRSIYDGIDQIIFAVDVGTDGEFQYAGFNPLGQLVLGLPDESEWYGKTPEAVFGDELGAVMRESYINCVRSQNSVVWERCLKFQGADTWWLVTLTPLPDETGKIYRIICNSKEITERKQAADQLLEYQRKLEESQRIAHIGNWEFDMATGEITLSDELKRILGLQPEQPAPSYPEFRQQIHPNDREGFQQTIDEAIALRQPYEIDHRLYRSDGQLRYVISWGQVLENQEGEVVKIFGASIDITDRKQAELALQVSQKRLRAVVKNAPIVLACIDRRGIFTLSEGKALEPLGFKAGEAVGLSVYELYKDFPQIIENINLVFAGEERTWRAELNRVIYETRGTPILDEKGEVVGLIAVSVDITERARVEEALRQSEAKLRLILENMPVMLSAVDADRNIIVWNRECEQVLGYSAPELVGNLQAIQVLVPDLNYRQKIFRKVVEFGHNFRDLEVEMIADDGSVKTIAWSNVSADFSVPGWDFWGIGVDVTERTAAELALRTSEAQLREQAAQLEIAYHALENTQAQLVQSEKMSSLGQLVAGVAHEINNPVSFIFGNISYAKDYTTDLLRILELYRTAYPEPSSEIQAELEEIDLDFIQEDLPNLLESMAVGAHRIQEIVKSLRTFSRLDEAAFKQVNLHEGIDSTLMIVAHRLKPHGDKPGIAIIKEYGNLPPIECYSGQLNQVFMNLLINAIDAMEEKAKNYQSAGDSSSISTINIRTEVVAGERVKISIADSGTGIPESVQQRLFDPFFTTKPVGKGTGLGLAISYEIVVKKHQGTLRCNSELGSGTEFAIEIPIRQLPAE
ncbi:PAS domain S-box protein [Microcoleus sp. bin38.metabat.b11b12b14.051]|uniref:PAS domain S-box protein n=1 Tax=Microcoleus sp. bin38.metabat.b11b12b14.051 TaxID=2742709 RepID=UPI0025CBBB1B|nr:PAS domain S-box protein [Microcoleus sp. bin38.metabat.b11b12b14.051]